MFMWLCVSPLLIFCAVISRFLNVRNGIGIGPEPLINNIFHKAKSWVEKMKLLLLLNLFYHSDFDKIFNFGKDFVHKKLIHCIRLYLFLL